MPVESLILFVLLGGLLLLMVSRTRRQQRETANLQAGLTEGSRIMTTAGLYATVVELDGAVVTLETAPGQRSRWDRRAVAKILTDEPDAVTGESTGDDTDEVGEYTGERPGPQTTRPDGTAGTGVTSQDVAPPERA
jgi:preprotein translocase subunit YajC